MELGGALEFLRFLLPLQTARHVAERSVSWERLRVDSLLGFLRSGGSRLNFLRFYLGTIFWREDALPFQILHGVNVL